jgi:hypothetical protein
MPGGEFVVSSNRTQGVPPLLKIIALYYPGGKIKGDSGGPHSATFENSIIVNMDY